MSGGASYRRVPQADATSSSDGANNNNLEASVRRSFSERLTDKAVALGWVLAAFFVAKWTDFFSVVLTSDRPNRTLLRLAMIGIGINTSLMIYLTIYLPKVKKITDSSAWSVYCPRVIPTMTLVGIVSFLLSLRALWPVWGFLAPLVVGVELMGALFGLHFVPLPNF